MVHCEDREHLERRLADGERLRVKFGVDPSAPDLHLGHTVPMGFLRRWQMAGHLPVVVIGDFTARIGDPSGRSATRPQLEPEQVEANAQTYLDQLFRLLDPARTEVRRQSEWFGDFTLDRVLRLAQTSTVAQLLQRSEFQQRIDAEQAIGLHELLYPLMQGYDSVAVQADLELGGTDQLFNLLFGRHVQGALGQPRQDVVTMPILEGLDGRLKMSKSLDNAVAVAAPAEEQFGQLMSIPDSLILRYFELLTPVDQSRLQELERDLSAGALNPRDAKAEMARTVVARFHGADAAAAAAEEFFRVHRGRELPRLVPEVVVPVPPRDLRELIRLAGLASSNSEAARLIDQGAVRLDGERLPSWREPVGYRGGSILEVGPKRAVRLVVQ